MNLDEKISLCEILKRNYEFIGLARDGEYAVFSNNKECVYLAKYDKSEFVCKMIYGRREK